MRTSTLIRVSNNPSVADIPIVKDIVGAERAAEIEEKALQLYSGSSS
jgi:hypothetical protein